MASMARPDSSVPKTSEAGEGGQVRTSDDVPARGTETTPYQEGLMEDSEGSSPTKSPPPYRLASSKGRNASKFRCRNLKGRGIHGGRHALQI